MMKIKNKGKAEFVRTEAIIISDANTTTVRDSVVSVFPDRPADATTNQTLRLLEQSGTLDFWLEECEDVYTNEDGEPI